MRRFKTVTLVRLALNAAGLLALYLLMRGHYVVDASTLCAGCPPPRQATSGEG